MNEEEALDWAAMMAIFTFIPLLWPMLVVMVVMGKEEQKMDRWKA